MKRLCLGTRDLLYSRTLSRYKPRTASSWKRTLWPGSPCFLAPGCSLSPAVNDPIAPRRFSSRSDLQPERPAVMPLVIRRYRPSDEATVLTLFGTCTREHTNPCFVNAMSGGFHRSIILALGIAGYLLGSVFGAVLLPAAWTGLVYYCCYTLYDSYVRLKLNSDMSDIVGNFMSRPDDCFWVAEAEVEGRAQVVGMVAVVAKQSGKEQYGELFRMIISPQFRRMGLGSKLAETVLAFSEKRAFSKVVLETSSTQKPAVALYKKLGFRLVSELTQGELPNWIVWLSRIMILRMEKDM